MKNLSLIILMALSMVLTSCDEHEPIDLDIHPGDGIVDGVDIVR